MFCTKFGVEAEGNVDEDPRGEFTGRNILYEAQAVADESRLAHAKETLFHARGGRPRPHLDRKILTSWNGMMISAFAKGYVVLGDEQYLRAAERAAAFFTGRMYDAGSGQLRRRFCDDEAAVAGFLDDYGMLASALLDLFEATFDPPYLQGAVDLVRHAITQFEDKSQGGFFSSGEYAPDLLLRMKDDYDGAEPSGNSVMTELLLRLAHLTGDDVFRASAERSLTGFAPKIKAQPTMAPQMLVAMDRWLAEPEQVVIRCAKIDAEVREMLADRRRHFAANTVLLALTDDDAASIANLAPFLAQLERKGRITVYECRNFTCELPRVIE